MAILVIYLATNSCFFFSVGITRTFSRIHFNLQTLRWPTMCLINSFMKITDLGNLSEVDIILRSVVNPGPSHLVIALSS